MAEYDGSVRIKTEIDSKNVTSQMLALENRIAKTADKVASLRAKMDSLKSAKIPTDEYKNLEIELSNATKEMEKMLAQDKKLSDINEKIKKLSESSNDYASQIKKMSETKLPTYMYASVQKQIEAAEKKLNSLYEKQNKFLETGGKTRSTTYKNMEYDIEQLTKKIERLNSSKTTLEEKGLAFKPGIESEEYEKISAKYQEINQKLEEQKKLHGEITQNQADSVQKVIEIKEQMEQLNKSGKAFTFGSDTQEYEKLGQQLGYAENELAALTKRHDELIAKQRTSTSEYKKMGKVAKSSLDGIGKGFKNIIKYGLGIRSIYLLINKFITAIKEGFENLAQYSDETNASISSVMSALTQFKNSLATAFAPILNVVAPAITKLINLLSAATTKIAEFMAAITGKSTYTKAVKVNEDYAESLNNTASAAKKAANALFAFDELNVVQQKDDGVSGTGTDVSEMFEEVPIDSSIYEIADILKETLGYAKKLKDTIATNLIGGISKYLSQNKDRIKSYLISMFDIGSDINSLFSDFFQSFAYVFEAFASENGQQLTANIIGMFTDAFMGITELASKYFRDLVNIIIQPFVDNKELFRSTLEGFLGILSVVTGTIKDGIDETFDKLNEVYDEHFKPFFDSIASGLSDTVGKFLEFWNGNVQPILEEWAQNFDSLWAEHIQPMLNSFIELFGYFADFLSAIWENKIKPMIDFITEYLLPAIIPIINEIVKRFSNGAVMIADIVKGIIDVFKGVIQFLTGAFTGDWEKAWEGVTNILYGVWDVIKSVVNGILGTIESMANGVVDGINKVIEALNSIKFEVPDWVPGFGGKSFSGFNIQPLDHVSIPRLATGAVLPANKPFMAVVGDQKRGTNVEAPLDTIKQAVRDVLQDYDFGGQGGDVYISAEGDLDALVRLLKFRIEKENKRVGKNFEKVVTV